MGDDEVLRPHEIIPERLEVLLQRLGIAIGRHAEIRIEVHFGQFANADLMAFRAGGGGVGFGDRTGESAFGRVAVEYQNSCHVMPLELVPGPPAMCNPGHLLTAVILLTD